jgi:hypothetical protein
MKKCVGMILILFIGVSLDASVYKGQRAYMKLCKSCHGSGGKLVKQHTREEWENYFKENGKLLKLVHAKDEKAMEKLHSPMFLKNIKHMRQFFHKYASDTGNIPACN